MEWNPSIHQLSWFRQAYQLGNLEIRPPYQRGPVWAARQKNNLIETILLNLPIPEIFIQQVTTPEGDTTYAIVDGQQRIRTVLQFIGIDMDSHQQEFNNFALNLLPDSSPWRDLTFRDLSDAEKKAFYEYRFVVRYLNTDSDEEVRGMFRRLNEFLTSLKPQELRNAVYVGPFAALAARLAENSYLAQNGVVTPAAIRRMGDVEFVSELLIGVLHGPQGGSARTIDMYYKQYEDFLEGFPEQAQVEDLYDRTLRTIRRLYPDIKDTRWHNKSDFYSLFVALASLFREMDLPALSAPVARSALDSLASEVNRRIGDENAKVSKLALEYTRAVEKGANDKARRATRHSVLLQILEPFFERLTLEQANLTPPAISPVEEAL